MINEPCDSYWEQLLSVDPVSKLRLVEVRLFSIFRNVYHLQVRKIVSKLNGRQLSP